MGDPARERAQGFELLDLAKMLLEKGIFLQAIRPPTVPAGTSRLRLTIVRGLTKEDMDQIADAIEKIHANRDKLA